MGVIKCDRVLAAREMKVLAVDCFLSWRAEDKPGVTLRICHLQLSRRVRIPHQVSYFEMSTPNDEDRVDMLSIGQCLEPSEFLFPSVIQDPQMQVGILDQQHLRIRSSGAETDSGTGGLSPAVVC